MCCMIYAPATPNAPLKISFLVLLRLIKIAAGVFDVAATIITATNAASATILLLLLLVTTTAL